MILQQEKKSDNDDAADKDGVLGGSNMSRRNTMIVMGENIDNCSNIRTCLGEDPIDMANQLLEELVVVVLCQGRKRLSWNGINWMVTLVGSGCRVS